MALEVANPLIAMTIIRLCPRVTDPLNLSGDNINIDFKEWRSGGASKMPTTTLWTCPRVRASQSHYQPDRKRESQHHVNGYEFRVVDCVRDCVWLAVPESTEWERIGRSDRRRDDLYAGGLHKYGHMSWNCHESKVGGGDDATGRRSKGMVQAGVVVGQDITGACEFKDLVAWSG